MMGAAMACAISALCSEVSILPTTIVAPQSAHPTRAGTRRLASPTNLPPHFLATRPRMAYVGEGPKDGGNRYPAQDQRRHGQDGGGRQRVDQYHPREEFRCKRDPPDYGDDPI